MSGDRNGCKNGMRRHLKKSGFVQRIKSACTWLTYRIVGGVGQIMLPQNLRRCTSEHAGKLQWTLGEWEARLSWSFGFLYLHAASTEDVSRTQERLAEELGRRLHCVGRRQQPARGVFGNLLGPTFVKNTGDGKATCATCLIRRSGYEDSCHS